MVTALIGLWLVGAVFSDGWAHFNVPELESFFTPWHLALYAGFAVIAVWVGLLAWRGRRPGTVPLEWMPYGYRGAVGPSPRKVDMSSCGHAAGCSVAARMFLS